MPENEKSPGQQFVELTKFLLVLAGIAVVVVYLLVRG
jgi:hypothetical protein